MIVGIGGDPPEGSTVIDLGDAILLPGLMDMEVNLFMGGRGENAGPIPGTGRPADPGAAVRSATPVGHCGPASRPSATSDCS